MRTISPALLALQRLYHWERTQPGQIALVQPLGQGAVLELTWSQVANQVRRMAAHLQAQGWERGSKVAILSKNCAWWLMSDLAIWMAGHVSVPLYPTLGPDTLAHILRHSGARACFIGKLDEWEHLAPGIPTDLPCISYPLSPAGASRRCSAWDAICTHTAPQAGEPTRPADDLATLIYTSGTTGVPKGVMHSFGNFAWAIEQGLRRIPMVPSDRLLSYLPLAHVVERLLIEHGWLQAGFRVYFAESLDTFTTDLQRAQPTVFFSVPRLWVKFQNGIHQKLSPSRLKLLLRLPLVGTLVRRKILRGLGLAQCRMAAGGAAPMPLALLQWFRGIGLPINEGYGMTENLAISHLTVPGTHQEGSVGPPFDGVEHRIDPESGEIQMRSQALMLGYYKAPELTRDAFTPDGWLRTGDQGFIDNHGWLHITGRVKDLFKTSKGKYVAPAPIEDKLVMHKSIEACVVSGSGSLGQPLGIAMLNAQAMQCLGDAAAKAALEASLVRHLHRVNATLEPHERLQCLVVARQPWTVENDLITPTFKVKRNRIENVYGAQYADWVASGREVVWQNG